MSRGHRNAVVAPALACAWLCAALPAGATTYTPNTTADHAITGCTNKDCTLREAVLTANAHPGADVVVLKSGKTYGLKHKGDDDAAAKGDLDLNDKVTIRASGRHFAAVNAHRIDRVFDVGGITGTTATFKRLRITGGAPKSFRSGGGIQVQDGKARVIRSQISGNRSFRGGGIATLNSGTSVLVSRSTLSNNRALTVESVVSDGGAVYITDDSKLTVSASTLNDNTATETGGALSVESGATAKVTNSTLANNSAGTYGGGIASYGDTTISSATVARNLAGTDEAETGFGGGIYDGGGFFNVENSIVAENAVAAGGFGPDCSSAFSLHFNSLGVNLLTNFEESCDGFSDPPDIQTSNAKLGLLADNGGPTDTIALKNSSPAINAAGDGSPARDQRGQVRDATPDIGAFER
jgi:CSLREA domain-containing protein